MYTPARLGPASLQGEDQRRGHAHGRRRARGRVGGRWWPACPSSWSWWPAATTRRRGSPRSSCACAPPRTPDAFDRAVAAAARPKRPSSWSGSTTTGRPRARPRRRSSCPAGRSSSSRRWPRRSRARSSRWWRVRRSTCRGPTRCRDCCGAGYPGQEGGRAVADVLFGDADPGGRLPCTMPAPRWRHARRSSTPRPTPACSATRRACSAGTAGTTPAEIEPAFPFGYGLSYTTFTVDPPAAELGRGGGRRHDRRRRAHVQNTGGARRHRGRAGSTWRRRGRIRPPASARAAGLRARCTSSRARPPTSRLRLGMRDLAFWDPRSDAWVAETGEHVVWAGRSSRDLAEPVSFVLTERWTAPASGPLRARVASVGCTRSSGSGTSPGHRVRTSACWCARPPRRWPPSVTTRPGSWPPAGASSIVTPPPRRCGGCARGC